MYLFVVFNIYQSPSCHAAYLVNAVDIVNYTIVYKKIILTVWSEKIAK